jgi:hypothetical protein
MTFQKKRNADVGFLPEALVTRVIAVFALSYMFDADNAFIDFQQIRIGLIFGKQLPFV